MSTERKEEDLFVEGVFSVLGELNEEEIRQALAFFRNRELVERCLHRLVEVLECSTDKT